MLSFLTYYSVECQTKSLSNPCGRFAIFPVFLAILSLVKSAPWGELFPSNSINEETNSLSSNDLVCLPGMQTCRFPQYKNREILPSFPSSFFHWRCLRSIKDKSEFSRWSQESWKVWTCFYGFWKLYESLHRRTLYFLDISYLSWLLQCSSNSFSWRIWKDITQAKTSHSNRNIRHVHAHPRCWSSVLQAHGTGPKQHSYQLHGGLKLSYVTRLSLFPYSISIHYPFVCWFMFSAIR